MTEVAEKKEGEASNLKLELAAVLERTENLSKQLNDAKRTLEIERARARGVVVAMKKEIVRWRLRADKSSEEWRSAHGSVKMDNVKLREGMEKAEGQLAAAKTELANAKEELAKASYKESSVRSTLEIFERRAKVAEAEAAKALEREEARKVRAAGKTEQKTAPVENAKPAPKDVARN